MEALPKPCKKRGCPHYVRGNAHHPKCKTPDVDLAKVGKKRTASAKMHDDRRGSSAARGYGYAWQKARAGYLAKPHHALCDFCTLLGFTTQATVVDHIKPYSSFDTALGKKVYDKSLQWDKLNWQPLCKHHHDVDKQKIEDRWRKGLLSDEALKGIGVKLSMPV
ncbi:MAG: hypothetical protein COB24_08910 [Hyphomicrobiales bacterium]|nr:MAG: hypothetical protein COB24_08910 [Hyphomicrobiales bacterium]